MKHKVTSKEITDFQDVIYRKHKKREPKKMKLDKPKKRK